MIQRQPKRPGVVIESQRKADSQDKQDRQYDALIEIGQRDAGEINGDDDDFSRDHVRHNRADKEALFTFEDYAAGIATVLQVERPFDDGRATADRALQFE